MDITDLKCKQMVDKGGYGYSDGFVFSSCGFVCELRCVFAKKKCSHRRGGRRSWRLAALAMAPSGLLTLPTPLPGAFVADTRACSGRVSAASKSEEKRAVRFDRTLADSRASELGLRSGSKSAVCSLCCDFLHGLCH